MQIQTPKGKKNFCIKRKEKKPYVMVPAGIEPATLSVWRTRDNHYTKEPLSTKKPSQDT